MLKRLINTIILFGIAVLAFFLDVKYTGLNLNKSPYLNLTKITTTFTVIAIAYFILKFVLEEAISKRIKDPKARYSFRKVAQILFLAVIFIIILRVWIVNPQALLVAYGLIAAGIAISLQDVFKNFAGTIAILLSDVYRVGDRIEISSKYGDVIDIGLFYTSLIEIREWVDGDQTTGRIILLPNGQVLTNPIQNYTKDHSFIWEEITLPITYHSNWKKASQIIMEIIERETTDATLRAKREIFNLEEKYFLSKRNIEPAIFIKLTDNWIMMSIRFVVSVRDRRIIKNNISKLILDAIQSAPDITIASATLTVTQGK